MSQQSDILTYLGNGHFLTVAEALRELGVYALSQRCGELRRQGYPIVSEMIKTPTGKRIARYRLEEKIAYG